MSENETAWGRGFYGPRNTIGFETMPSAPRKEGEEPSREPKVGFVFGFRNEVPVRLLPPVVEDDATFYVPHKFGEHG